MALHHNTRLAWSVAVASLALWATSAPVTWGQVAANAERFFQSADTTTTTVQTVVDETTTNVTENDTAQSAPCPPQVSSQQPAPAVPAPASGANEGTFHLCGASADTARAIEQLIAGRSFSATLSAHGDGCADLTIRITSSAPTSGTASSNLTVSLGGGQSLSIQIKSVNGVTNVDIGQTR